MSQVTLPYTLTAGQPENVNQLNANLAAIVAGVNAVDASQIDSSLLVQGGLTGNSIVRRGKSVVSAAEARTNVAYGKLGTPDQVSNIVLPTDGLIFVLFHALWQESAAMSARAALFLDATQIKTAGFDSASASQETATNASASANKYLPLVSGPGGLQGLPISGAFAASGNATEALPQIVGGLDPTGLVYPNLPYGGVTAIAAAAGTYTLSVQFKASGGATVTVKNRHLHVWTMGF